MKAQAMTPAWGSEILHVPRIAFVSLLVAEILLCRRSSSAQGASLAMFDSCLAPG